MESKLTDNLDTLINDIRECKTSLEMLLYKLENENMDFRLDWSTLLNSLRILSTNLVSITKFIKDRRELMFKTSIVVPKHFSEDVDLAVKEATNNRISIFNQDVIPNILRTKLIPAIEVEETKCYQEAKEFEKIKTFDKNVTQLKKTIDESANLIEKPKRELDSNKLTFSTTTFNYRDTWQLADTLINLSNIRQPQRAAAFPRHQ